MPDKNPKNKVKLKVRAEVKHEVGQEWKHESPTQKKETHQHDETKKILESDKA